MLYLECLQKSEAQIKAVFSKMRLHEQEGASSQTEAEKQSTLLASISSGSVPQAKVDKLIINLVINYMKPLSVVEQSFIDFDIGLQPVKKILSHNTLKGN